MEIEEIGDDESWELFEMCGVYEDVFVRGQTKRKRVKRGHVNEEILSKSIWGQMLQHPDIAVPNSYTGMSFRLRFRVPYCLFKNVLVPECIAKNVFNERKKS